MKKRDGRGGARPGAGRPRIPIEARRRNRVVVMLTDGELARLQRLAQAKRLPLGTVAYGVFARGLARR